MDCVGPGVECNRIPGYYLVMGFITPSSPSPWTICWKSLLFWPGSAVVSVACIGEVLDVGADVVSARGRSLAMRQPQS
jgi:hypothetical protein